MDAKTMNLRPILGISHLGYPNGSPRIGPPEPLHDADPNPPPERHLPKPGSASPPTRFEILSLALSTTAVALGVPPFVHYLQVFVGASQGPQTPWPVAFAYLLQNALLVLILTLFTARFYALYRVWHRQYSRLDRRFTHTLAVFARLFHNLTHLKRDLLSNSDQHERVVPVPQAVDTLISYCDDIKEGLEYLFHDRGCRFNVTIKAIHSQTQDDFNVVVVARHRHMTQACSHRADDTRRHLLKRNTAFERLFRFRPPVFASDDLVGMHERGEYENTSPDWRDRYNATIVVPIRKNRITKDDDFELVGFIGVDTEVEQQGFEQVFCRGNGKAREDILDFLLSYADSTYGILTRAKVVDKQGIRGPLGHCVINPHNFKFVDELHHEYLRRCRPSKGIN